MIEDQETNYVVVLERDILLPCQVTGVPPPEVHWFKDGLPISSTDFSYRILQSNALAIPVVRSVFHIKRIYEFVLYVILRC